MAGIVTDSRPLLSIVMPAYNAEATVVEALESLESCGVDDYELIVVNDGSTDGTWATLSSYMRPRQRVTAVDRKRNSGVAAASNTTLLLAKGRYIARMDADDVSLPGRIAQQISVLEKEPDLAFCGTQVTTFGLEDTWGRGTHLPTTPFGCFVVLPFHAPFVHPTVVFHRERCGAELYYDPTLSTSEDYELWVRLALADKPGTNLDLAGLKYRMSAQQATSVHIAKFRSNDVGIRARLLARILEPDVNLAHVALAVVMTLQLRNFTPETPYLAAIGELLGEVQAKPRYAAHWRRICELVRQNLTQQAPAVPQVELPKFISDMTVKFGELSAERRRFS
ncbi:MAG TPA: glycosyltransferase family 2 protein [Devosia sp.]|jgi:glycosyltransferase involved in cell wall biosynthesis|nr:glycosyltransferase family 2 protein [Devosia sp.]